MQYRVLFLTGLFAFISTQLCASSVYNGLDNFIHIDYIKRKYPEVDVHELKTQAIHDNQTVSPYFHIKPSDKIESWLQAISTKYPQTITGGSNVTFGVPYYIFVPYAILNMALIYWLAKR
jgi:hypothetical protein